LIHPGALSKRSKLILKLRGHMPGLPGNVISFYIVPLDPAHSAGLAGHVPVKRDTLKVRRISKKGWNFHGLETNVDHIVL